MYDLLGEHYSVRLYGSDMALNILYRQAKYYKDIFR